MKSSISTRNAEEIHLPPLRTKLIIFRASHHLNVYAEFGIIPHHIVGVYPHLLEPNNKITEIFKDLNCRKLKNEKKKRYIYAYLL